MGINQLADSPVGQLIDIAGIDARLQREYRGKAFLPYPLPDVVKLAGPTYAHIAEAAMWVGRADQSVRQLPNPALVVRPTIRREAVSTSALEGTYAAFTDVLEADFLGEDEMTSSVAEVVNFVRAAEAALGWVSDRRPITFAMLAELQKMLVRGTPADNAEAGHVRTTQVFIGVGGGRLEDARFVPPPPGDHLRDGCDDWQQWIQGGHDLHAIARSALAHYQFETLHPFNDGNGRIGRLVALLQLVTAGDLSSIVVNLSPWLKNRQQEYQDHLLNISATGEFDPWVDFYCQALCAHAAEVVARVDQLLVLRQELLDQARAERVRGTGFMLAGDLIGYPMVTARIVAELYSVSPQAANTAVGRLVDIGILRQRTEGRYARIFSCDAVLNTIDRG